MGLLGYQAKALAVMQPLGGHAICVFRQDPEAPYYIIDNCSLRKTQAKTLSQLAAYIFSQYRCLSICEIDFFHRDLKVLFQLREESAKNLLAGVESDAVFVRSSQRIKTPASRRFSKIPSWQRKQPLALSSLRK